MLDIDPEQDKECPNCQGEGIIDFPEGHPITEEESMAQCPTCNGTGSVPIDYEPCAQCGYDHGYETQHAALAHTNMMFAQAFDLRDGKKES